MGAEQSQDPSGSGQGLTPFCCNNNLCNNDANVDNKGGPGSQDTLMQRGGKHQFRKNNHNSNSSIHKATAAQAAQQENNNQFGAGSSQQLNGTQGFKQNQNLNQNIGSVPTNTFGEAMGASQQMGQNNQQFNNNGMYDQSAMQYSQQQNNSGLQQKMNSQQQINNNQVGGGIDVYDPQNIAEYKKKCRDLVSSSPILSLQIISSPTLQRGMTLTINAQGLFGQFQSEREKDQPGSGLDGFTYFGSFPNMVYDNNNDIQQNQQLEGVINDFVIPYRNQNQAEQHYGRHFHIWFDVLSRKYLIKDLCVGYGVFQKMDSGHALLKQNMLINVGDAHIFVTLIPTEAEEHGLPFEMLKLKYIGGQGVGPGDEFEFHVNEMRGGEREILIGRAPDCDLSINDKLLSKVQCHIKCIFDPLSSNQYQWVIYDGYKGKPSTNSTWLYISKDTLLVENFVFKANQTVFTVKSIQ